MRTPPPGDRPRGRRAAIGALLGLLALLVSAREAPAILIGHWDFNGGTAVDISGTPPPYDFGAVGGGPDLSGGFARFDGDEASPSYLQVTGPGGMTDWTLSIWVRTQGQQDQGAFQGIFSNNTSAGASYSWQLESFNGIYQWRNQAGTFSVQSGPSPRPLDTWDHIVLRKTGGNSGQAWFNGVSVLSFSGNPGGLQFFRMGTNRNTSAFWQGDVDDLRIYNDSTVDPVALFNLGPPVPEPSLMALLAMAAAAAAVQRRRR